MIWHMFPLNDIKEHADNSMCDCHPVLEGQPSGDFLCIHNSYDNREEKENNMVIIQCPYCGAENLVQEHGGVYRFICDVCGRDVIIETGMGK